MKFVFPYQENNRETTAHGGGEAREEAELPAFSLGFSVGLVNRECISHWGLMSVLLLGVDQESSEAHALTPRKGTSLEFALLGFLRGNSVLHPRATERPQRQEELSCMAWRGDKAGQ